MLLKRSWNAFWRKTDITAGFIFIMAGLAGVGLGSVVSSALDNDPPTIFEQARVLTPQVPQGGVLDIQYTVVQNRVCAASVDRLVTDSEGTAHVPATYTVDRRAFIEGYPPEGRESYQRSITVPLAAAIGKARYDVRFSYACNLWHKMTKPIIVNAPPAYFEITEAPAPLEPLTPEKPAS
ncbi:hypothetical protein C8D77_11160 [Mesorhizobium loti]|uniref:Uncharacterized protein n=1 Tax=Rhizobium loti TaxID=381 RepID=A0A8E2W825_RHILI|nr:hypothetical protein [Mesorhizobium loti]PWJ88338.1 hypothetical protein C8D77_11160 [Mesorhizobium loti]